MTAVQSEQLEQLGSYKFGWADADTYADAAQRGLTEAVVRDISVRKSEPEWMLAQRLKGLKLFEKKPMPTWGADLSGIDFDNIKYFVRSTEQQAATWDELPEDIKNTYDRLGIPEAGKQRLGAGGGAQYECCRGDTLVWTANRGQIMIKEVEPGDVVFAYDETAERFVTAPVKASWQTGVRQTYEVVVGTRNSRRVIATDNHPMLALRDERDVGADRARWVRQWLTVGDLRQGDLVAVARQLPPFGLPHRLPTAPARLDHLERALAVPTHTNVDLMWLLGVFVGSGNLHDAGKTHRLQFSIPASQVALRAEIERVVEQQFGLRASADDDRILINSEALVSWLWNLGFGGTSKSERVPDWVFGLSEDQRLAFLGGWRSAEGQTRPAPDAVSRPTLVEQFQQLCDLTNSLDDSTGAADMTSGAQTSDWLGFAPGQYVEPFDVEPVYDIEVDGPHNFVAEGLVVHNSEVVYHKINEELERQGVIFLDTDTGLKEHPELFEEYFGSVIPSGDNKFAALNTAVWSGGSFIYVPKGVKVDIPLQAYFRINTENMGQFERTLIIVDEDAYVHYVEGCTAPIYKSDSLHSAVVEIIVKKGARCRYTTIQNWSNNVYNLVTKRAVAHANATMEWVDGNLGSKVTMKSPAVYLMGEHARGETLSIAFAGEGQHQDTGSKMVHAAPNTKSVITSKSISKDGGRASYRGLLRVNRGAVGARSKVVCDALILDEQSQSDTFPYINIGENEVDIGHEATVSKIGEEQLYYLMSRGLDEAEASAMIVAGFVEPITKELPLEYAVEMNRLIQLQMEGSVG